jgi:hypothetical protein
LWEGGTGWALREISACIVCGCSWISPVQIDDYCGDGGGDDNSNNNNNNNSNNNGIIYLLD